MKRKLAAILCWLLFPISEALSSAGAALFSAAAKLDVWAARGSR